MRASASARQPPETLATAAGGGGGFGQSSSATEPRGEGLFGGGGTGLFGGGGAGLFEDSLVCGAASVENNFNNISANITEC